MQEEPVEVEPVVEPAPVEVAAPAEEESVEETSEAEAPVEEAVAEEPSSEENASEPENAEASEESQNNGEGKKKSKKKLIIALAIAGAVVLTAGIAVPVSLVIADQINAANYMSVYKKPVVSNGGKTITYGLYPQTNVNNNKSLVNALDNLTSKDKNTGWYMYKNAYYAKVTADSDVSAGRKFRNGLYVSSGESYWFKCEPIKWKVLSHKKEDTYFVVSDQILGVRPYNSGNSNKYDASSIRTYLSNTFLKYAFGDNSYIPITSVNNSASTTDSYNNPYTCVTTSDKIFLPSYADYGTEEYGFASSEDRKCFATDYTIALGIRTDKSYYGHYWTRSPYSSDSKQACYVSYNGGRTYSSVASEFIGVRPAMNVRPNK